MDKDFISDELYKVITEKVPICAVDIVILNSDKSKTLLFKRNNEPVKGKFFTIGGRLFKDESIVECAVRQAKKELGILIDTEKLFWGGVQQENYPNSAFSEISYNIVDVFYGYILEDETVTIKLDNQHSVGQWFAVDDSTLHKYIISKLKACLSNHENNKTY